MAAAQSPCGGFKTRVLHFKVKNTLLKDKKWKVKVKNNAQFSFCGGRKGVFLGVAETIVDAFVLWCGYCSVSFQSFVLRHWCPQHQETTKKSFSSRNRHSRNSTLFSSQRSTWSVLKWYQGCEVFAEF